MSDANPSRARVPTLWGTITAVTPTITVRLDFTTRSVPVSYDTGLSGYGVGQRVVCQIVRNQVMVVGR